MLKAIELYRKAIKIDPGFAKAYAGLAQIGLAVWSDDETGIMPGAVAKKLAYESASKVRELDPQNPTAYLVLAELQATDGQLDIALQTIQLAIDLSPNNSHVLAAQANVLIIAGQHDAALRAISKALKLNPKPPEYFFGVRGVALYLSKQYAEAALSLEKVFWYRTARLMTYGQLGRTEDAKAVLAETAPFINLNWLRTLFAHYQRKQDVDLMIDGLRKGGVPENPFGFEGSAKDRLDSHALKTLAVGKTWSGFNSFGTAFTQQMFVDGRIVFTNSNAMQVGSAWLMQDRFCVKYRSNLLGRNDCGYIYRNPDGSRDQQNEYVWAAAGAIYYFSVDE